MQRVLCLLAVGALGLLLAVPPVHAQEGRDPEDNFEIEGHFGFYWNLNFPSDRDENSTYTTFLTNTTDPAFHPLFRPNLRSKDLRWNFGLRVSYDFRPRWALEWTFSFSQDDNFRANRAYTTTVVPERLTAVPALQLRRVREDDGETLIHWINLVYHTRESGRVVPYLTGGFNVITYGQGPLVDFLFNDASQETAVFAYEHRHTKVGGNIGAGLKLYMSRHVGVRVDVRFLLAAAEFEQRGAILRPNGPPGGSGLTADDFGPEQTSIQRGLYSNFHVTFGLFGRF